MTSLGLPVALVLGVLSSLVSAGVRRVGRRRLATRRKGAGDTLRRLVRSRKERASVLEVGGAFASLLGAGLATAAALGAVPSSGPLVYLALLAAAAGAHAAAGDPTTDLRADRVAAARRSWLLAEPAFVVSLGAALFRWRAADLEAVRGSQDVLGPGLAVGPPLAAAALILAAVAFLAAGALRLVPSTESVRSGGRRAGGAVLIGLCRWSMAGATAVAAGILVAGGDLVPVRAEAVSRAAVGAAAAAVVVGLADGLLTRFPRIRRPVATAAVVLAAGAAALAVAA